MLAAGRFQLDDIKVAFNCSSLDSVITCCALKHVLCDFRCVGTLSNCSEEIINVITTFVRYKVLQHQMELKFKELHVLIEH